MMLTGECNLCGACCFTKYGAVCEHLEILTRQGYPIYEYRRTPHKN